MDAVDDILSNHSDAIENYTHVVAHTICSATEASPAICAGIAAFVSGTCAVAIGLILYARQRQKKKEKQLKELHMKRLSRK